MKSSNYWRKRANRTNNPCDWFTDKNLKYQVRKLIRAAESEFVKDQTQNNPRNMQIVFGRQFASVSLMFVTAVCVLFLLRMSLLSCF